ncbi:MAG: hypothetical protein OXU45_04545, partial [Candidatus Melainabacteria bacterium]|nr:hypothetical protein [Candidatus Melainabacteria bacterium]
LEDFLQTENKAKSAAENCLKGLKKLRLAKHFAEIDDEILELSLATEESIGFFTQILNLEAKRLKFKEEALKSFKTENKAHKLSAA